MVRDTFVQELSQNMDILEAFSQRADDSVLFELRE